MPGRCGVMVLATIQSSMSSSAMGVRHMQYAMAAAVDADVATREPMPTRAEASAVVETRLVVFRAEMSGMAQAFVQ